MQSWYQLIPSIDLASNIVYKIKHYPRGKNKEKVARGSTYQLLLTEGDADVVLMTCAHTAQRYPRLPAAQCTYYKPKISLKLKSKDKYKRNSVYVYHFM